MKNEKRAYKFIKRIAKIVAILLLFVVALLLFIRSSWGQRIIVDNLVSYVNDKTGTRLTVDKLFITFSGDVEIQGVYLEDLQKDTLLYSKNLQAEIALSPLIFGNTVKVNELEWNGVIANISRAKHTEEFNFSFLLDAFVAPDPELSNDTSETMALDIGSISLSDFKINYVDEFLGIHSKNRIGSLYTDFENIDLEQLLFHSNEVQLSNSTITYSQYHPLPESDQDSTSVLPQLVFSKIQMNQVAAHYHSIPDNVRADVNIGELNIGLPKIDFATNSYEIDGLSIQNTNVALEIPQNDELSTKEIVSRPRNDFVWPEYIIEARNLSLKNNEFLFIAEKIDTVQNKFNPDNLHVSELNFRAKTISYEPKQANLDIEKLSFKEKSGLNLRRFSVKGAMDENQLLLSNMVLKTSRSSINGKASIDYGSIQKLIDSPVKAIVTLNVPLFTFDTRDLYVFEPSLASNEMLTSVSESALAGQLFAKGTLDEITVTDTAVKWGSKTSLQLDGTVFDGMHMDSLRVDLNSIIATTGQSDLIRFTTLKDSSLTLPEEIRLVGTASGSLEKLSATLHLESTMGSANFKGSGGLSSLPFIAGELTVDSLQLGNLLYNPQLKDISLSLDANLMGKDLESLTGDLEASISQFYWNDYIFTNLSAKANIEEGTGKVSVDYKDENLNLTSLTSLKLDSTLYNIKTSVDVIGANLKALTITQNDIRVGANIKATFLGTPEAFTIKSKITDAVSVMENEQFQTGDIDIFAAISPNTTEAKITSEFLNAGLEANGSPNQISKALLIQFENYFSDDAQFTSQPDSILVNLNANLTPEPILTEVFLKGIERLDTIKMSASFDSAKSDMNAILQLPFAQYNGGTVDSLNFVMNGDAKDLKFSFGMNALHYSPIHIKKTFFDGELKNQKLELEFISYDGKEKLAHIASEMQFQKDTLSLRINPENLTFNRKPWSVPQNNLITFTSNFLSFKDVVLSRNTQEIELSNTVPGIVPDHIGVLFKNFKLQTFLSLLNPAESLGTGIVQGNLIIENPFGATGILADVEINNLGVLENRLGNLLLNASSKELSKYTVDLAVKEGPINMDLTGNYSANTNGPALNLFLDLKKLETSVIAGFLGEELKNPEGFLSGQFELQGTLNQPIYEGNLSFNNTGIDIAALNTSFKVDRETVEIDETSVSLNTFAIEDANGSSFTIDGKINTEKPLNPSFDLNFKTEKFALLNSSAKDNDLYYGTASIDADVRLKGNLNLPKVDGKVRIRDVTELTYIVPEEQLDIEERDGVVIFVNRENSNAILTNNQEKNTAPLFRGLDANLIIEIAKEALFTLVLDEKTDDVLQVAGDAALNLNLNPNGTVGLTGRYELANGYYKTSLYNLVSRKFDMKSGSTIIWQGDPLDAKLDVTAIYRLETSAAPLMASETSGVEAGLASKYQQVMPFLVFLNVDGEITAPEISFDLGIPENAQGELGGVVYGKVQQLNAQEAELNKQVFSLLALNRFFPNTVSDGSSGGAAGLAKNNVNKVLSGELNTFSDKVFGNSGFELDFDLDSFTDYRGESAQDRTQLNINASKKLFNDRLIVTAGSAIDVEGSAQIGQEESPIIGNVSLEYLLTQNGRYRLKGYRKSEYTNVIDGQLIVTGLALIFSREFNEFSELFNPLDLDTITAKEESDKKANLPKVKNSIDEE